MHHFPFHISDFAQATARFTPEQVGVFLALLMEYYKTEKPLTSDVDELCFLAGAMTSGGKKAVEFVLKRCFVLNHDGSAYHQRRCDREIEAYRGRCVQNSYAILCRHWEKVNRGHAKPTFEKFQANPSRYYDAATGRILVVTGRNDLVLEPNDDGNTGWLQTGSQPQSTIHDPVTTIQDTPIVPKGTVTTGLPDFDKLAEAVYALYPRKVGKAAAIKAIVKVLKNGTITELELQTRVKRYAEAVAKWSEQDRTYIPNPSTWFNQGRYDDDPNTWIREPVENREKKKGGAAAELSFSDAPTVDDVAPPDWRLMWEELFSGPCPETWADVPDVNKKQIRAYAASKK